MPCSVCARGACFTAPSFRLALTQPTFCFVAPHPRAGLFCEDKSDIGALGVVYYLGVLFGALAGASLSDRYGRRPVAAYAELACGLLTVAGAGAPSYGLFAPGGRNGRETLCARTRPTLRVRFGVRHDGEHVEPRQFCTSRFPILSSVCYGNQFTESGKD